VENIGSLIDMQKTRTKPKRKTNWTKIILFCVVQPLPTLYGEMLCTQRMPGYY